MKICTTVALVALLVAPAPLAAQSWFEIQHCRGAGISCVVPLPPTGPGPVGAIVPFPLPAPPPPLPTYQVPLYTPPVYVAPPVGGINPWIPLMAVPPQTGRSAVETLLLLQLAAAAPRPSHAPAPVGVAPPTSAPTGAGWMSAFMKPAQ